ncbi:MAG TPA: Hsp20/alpha crystallin family protein [Candidatus Sulfotelmatobacter sp.]|nr:Hsp20/alpha crystallin family protein [Candidatus Sulfotelmatobacter sp.]
MSAQRSTELATSQRTGEQRGQQRTLARQSPLPSLPSLLLDPLGFFEDDPFSLMRRMQREMTRVFGQAGLDGSRQNGDVLSTSWIPATEIAYQDGNLVISAELPGLSEKDVKVEVNDDFLIIQGERKSEKQEGEGDVRRTERRYGEFYRAIALPEGADAQNARAELRNGVLQVTIPVPQSQRNVREIPVQASSSESGSEQHGSSSRQQGSTSQQSSGQQKAA